MVVSQGVGGGLHAITRQIEEDGGNWRSKAPNGEFRRK